MEDENTLIQCPYDNTHQILKGRFQVHLTRCRQNHTDVEKVACPFDSTHLLNKVELDWHVTVCPERKHFEHYKNKKESASRQMALGTLAPKSHIGGEENWDDDPFVQSYNPEKYASKANILRNIHGAPPSVRKEFRAKERQRLLQINQRK